MKPVYLILDPREPDVRVPLTRPANDVVLDVFAKCPDIDVVEIASGLTNEPHARYHRGDAGVVCWSGRVISRPNANPVTVAQSPNAGTWVDMGVVEPSPKVIRDHEALPLEWGDDLVGDDPDSKWSEWYAKQGERERYREAVGRLVEAGIIRTEDIYTNLKWGTGPNPFIQSNRR